MDDLYKKKEAHILKYIEDKYESLEIYFSLNDLVYLGPKKALAYLKANDPKGYKIFIKGLAGRSNEEIIELASYLESFR